MRKRTWRDNHGKKQEEFPPVIHLGSAGFGDWTLFDDRLFCNQCENAAMEAINQHNSGSDPSGTPDTCRTA